MTYAEYDTAPCTALGEHRITQRHPSADCPAEVPMGRDPETGAWTDGETDAAFIAETILAGAERMGTDLKSALDLTDEFVYALRALAPDKPQGPTFTVEYVAIGNDRTDADEWQCGGWAIIERGGENPGLVDVFMDEAEAYAALAQKGTHRLHYTSQDVGADTWSVYVEQYASKDDDEPIDGTQEWVATCPTQEQASALAKRLQALV